jgi:hypothetical protein
MPDDFDRAQDRVETDLALSIAVQQQAAQRAAAARKHPIMANRIRPTGFCQNLFCGEEFERGSLKLYCNSGCEQSSKRSTR